MFPERDRVLLAPIAPDIVCGGRQHSPWDDRDDAPASLLSSVSTRARRDHSPARQPQCNSHPPLPSTYCHRTEAALSLTRAPDRVHNDIPPPPLRRPAGSRPHCLCTGTSTLYRPAAIGDTCQRTQQRRTANSTHQQRPPRNRRTTEFDLSSESPPSSRPPRNRRLETPSSSQRASAASQRSHPRTTPGASPHSTC